jgi:hypothetical protein
VREDAAFQILLERLAHVGLGRVVVALPVELPCAGQIKPGLVVLGHRLVQQRAFGVARVVELGLGFGCSGHRYCANTQYFADFSLDLSSAGLHSVGALAQLALTWGWLDARWQGLSAYVWPLVLWQTAACFAAAHAHLPFQKGLAVQHAWLCVAMNAGFIALCVALPWVIPLSASTHMAWLSAYMLLSLAGLTLWVAKR